MSPAQILSLPAPCTREQTILDERGFSWDPWSIEERRVIYEYLNAWISHHGLDAFATKIWTKNELVFLADTINKINAMNEVGAAPRSVHGVKMQIRELGRGRLGPLAKLTRRSKALKLNREMGQMIEDEERFPEMAIPVPTVAEGVYTVKDNEASEEAVRENTGAEVEAVLGQEMKQQQQKKRKLVKLSVDWARLHARKSGKMAVLEDEVWESP